MAKKKKTFVNKMKLFLNFLSNISAIWFKALFETLNKYQKLKPSKY